MTATYAPPGSDVKLIGYVARVFGQRPLSTILRASLGEIYRAAYAGGVGAGIMAVMPTIGLSGEVLSDAVNAVSKIKAEFYGRGPEGGKAYLNDNLLVVVFRGGLLDVEETLIERGRADKVRDLRITWQEEVEDEVTQQIEKITGLKVLDYHSQILVHARVIVELFLLADG